MKQENKVSLIILYYQTTIIIIIAILLIIVPCYNVLRAETKTRILPCRFPLDFLVSLPLFSVVRGTYECKGDKKRILGRANISKA